MPRGIPNAKRDDMGMKYTTFSVPLLPNPKNIASSYLKYDSQTIWGRNAARQANKPKVPEDLIPLAPEERRGSKVVVIHPGSRWLRIGKASDVAPILVDHIIARRHASPVPPTTLFQNVGRFSKGKEKASPITAEDEDGYPIANPTDDSMESKVASIASSLRDRMRFYKLKITAGATQTDASFNEQFQPEVVEDNRKNRINWIMDPPGDDVLIGEKAFLLSDPAKLGYTLKRPIYGGRFNTRDYSSHQAVLNDLEVIWRRVFHETMQINPKTFKDYSVLLVIPDIWDRFYVQELINLLLGNMGFKQICVQQESLAATYGAGISNACVVDIGAVKTSVACVDDGLVLGDTRLLLSVGGNDITEFLYVLLERVNFPYKECDLARSYDWLAMEDIKFNICSLSESDVEMNLYEIVVRRPGQPSLKYGYRVYDELIIAPMIIFEPRVVDFEKKRVEYPLPSNIDVADELFPTLQDRLTGAMFISTSHLMPQAQAQGPPVPGNAAPTTGQEMPQEGVISVDEDEQTLANQKTAETGDATPGGGSDKKPGEGKTEPEPIEVEVDSDNKRWQDTQARQSEEKSLHASTDVKQPMPDQQPVQPLQATSILAASTPTVNGRSQFLGDLPIDVCFEASKLPLDVAIFNSARAAGGHDKIRKYLQQVLVIGGTASLPGMAHALESRLQAIATPLVPNMDKVQIIAPPRDAHVHTLAWKGAAVLAKMDGVADLWLSTDEWQLFGLRGLKERCYYL